MYTCTCAKRIVESRTFSPPGSRRWERVLAMERSLFFCNLALSEAENQTYSTNTFASFIAVTFNSIPSQLLSVVGALGI